MSEEIALVVHDSNTVVKTAELKCKKCGSPNVRVDWDEPESGHGPGYTVYICESCSYERRVKNAD